MSRDMARDEGCVSTSPFSSSSPASEPMVKCWHTGGPIASALPMPCSECGSFASFGNSRRTTGRARRTARRATATSSHSVASSMLSSIAAPAAGLLLTATAAASRSCSSGMPVHSSTVAPSLPCSASLARRAPPRRWFALMVAAVAPLRLSSRLRHLSAAADERVGPVTRPVPARAAVGIAASAATVSSATRQSTVRRQPGEAVSQRAAGGASGAGRVSLSAAAK
mmetsp:Transcript_28095/g.71088  ORF Transcript_28095/g.71088 Transcript_28095/m.71088 type:complete len:225 (-) Transcript_28095:137-811(-)